MTPKQYRLAAKIYSLGIIANMDTHGHETPDTVKVASLAISRATRQLKQLGLVPGDVKSDAEAIECAIKLTKP